MCGTLDHSLREERSAGPVLLRPAYWLPSQDPSICDQTPGSDPSLADPPVIFPGLGEQLTRKGHEVLDLSTHEHGLGFEPDAEGLDDAVPDGSGDGQHVLRGRRSPVADGQRVFR